MCKGVTLDTMTYLKICYTHTHTARNVQALTQETKKKLVADFFLHWPKVCLKLRLKRPQMREFFYACLLTKLKIICNEKKSLLNRLKSHQCAVLLMILKQNDPNYGFFLQIKYFKSTFLTRRYQRLFLSTLKKAHSFDILSVTSQYNIPFNQKLRNDSFHF